MSSRTRPASTASGNGNRCFAFVPHPSPVRRSRCSPRSRLCAGGGCAAYRFGQSSLYNPDVRTVYVPMIESDSFRRNLGERLTEAVMKQIETDTPYKVVNTPDADTTLYVRLVNDTKRMQFLNIQGDVRDTELNMQMQVSWVSRQGTILSEQNVALPPEMVDIGQKAQLIPEYGRSVASTQQEIINRLASRITGLMETGW
ncbi:MAG: LPS assembly lipoprotein LptE [Pirellulales bacterium]